MDEKDYLLIIGSCAVIILSVFALFLMGFGGNFRSSINSGSGSGLSHEKEILDLVAAVDIKDQYLQAFKNTSPYNLKHRDFQAFLNGLKIMCLDASASGKQDNLVKAYALTLKSMEEDGVKFESNESSPSALQWECL